MAPVAAADVRDRAAGREQPGDGSDDRSLGEEPCRAGGSTTG
jgi:hypothetical protein